MLNINCRSHTKKNHHVAADGKLLGTLHETYLHIASNCYKIMCATLWQGDHIKSEWSSVMCLIEEN